MSTTRQVVHSADAPAAIGPYSQAIRHGGLLYCSGQLGLDPATGEFVGKTAVEQAEQALTNLQNVAEAAGTSLARAVKVTVYFVDMADFAPVNEVYARFFDDAPPARVGLAVAELPRAGRVEIDAIIAVDD